MADLCHHCGQPSDDGARPLKVLPCGHTACMPCIGEQPAAEGRRCPVCNKIFKIDVTQLVTAQTPESHRVWCRDCDAVARAVCLDEHAVCGQGALRREAAAALAECRAGRADVLHALAEAARREEQLLRQEPELSPAAGLAALRAELAAARAHPLHGLQQGLQGQQEQPLAVDELLRRALAALRNATQPKIEPQPGGSEAAALDRQQQLGEKEADLARREAAVQQSESAVQDRQRQQEDKEVDLARREATLKQSEEAVQDRQRQQEEKEADLAERETTWQEANTALEVAKARLDTAEQVLAVRTVQLNEREVQLDDREMELVRWQGNLFDREEEVAESRPAGSPSRRRGDSTATSSSTRGSRPGTSASSSSTSVAASSAPSDVASTSDATSLAMGVAASLASSDATSMAMGVSASLETGAAAASAPGEDVDDGPAASGGDELFDTVTPFSPFTPGSPRPESEGSPEPVLQRSSMASVARAAVAGPSSSAAVPRSTEAVQEAAATPENQGPCHFDALPDEVLEKVLAFVPAGRYGFGLLQLRQVCRRWKRIIGDSAGLPEGTHPSGRSAVWRHRTVHLEHWPIPTWQALSPQWQVSDYGVSGEAALRCAPAVRRVEVHVQTGYYSTAMRRTLQKLERCAAYGTKVTELRLEIPVTKITNRYASEALYALRSKLQELDLHMTFSGNCEPPTLIAASLTQLHNLTALKISQACSSSRSVRPKLDWDLRSLTKLQRLTVGTELSGAMVRGLLEASKASLLEVDFGPQEVHEAVAGCTALRAVTVRTATSRSLAHLKLVPTLETVTFDIEATVSLPAAAGFLASSPAIPSKVNLSVKKFTSWSTLQTALPSLDHRVRTLSLQGDLYMDVGDLALCLAHLSGLEEVHLRELYFGKPGRDIVESSARFNRGDTLVAWAEQAGVLPAGLKELHIHECAKLYDCNLEMLRDLRPGLRVCNARPDERCSL